MNNIFKLITLIFCSFIIAQDSKGGIPYSLGNDISINSNKQILPILDVTQLMEEDKNRPPATPGMKP